MHQQFLGSRVWLYESHEAARVSTHSEAVLPTNLTLDPSSQKVCVILCTCLEFIPLHSGLPAQEFILTPLLPWVHFCSVLMYSAWKIPLPSLLKLTLSHLLPLTLETSDTWHSHLNPVSMSSGLLIDAFIVSPPYWDRSSSREEVALFITIIPDYRKWHSHEWKNKEFIDGPCWGQHSLEDPSALHSGIWGTWFHHLLL